MKIVYIEESDSAIIDPELPDEFFSGPISGYDLDENVIVHRDAGDRIRSIEILSGASEFFDPQKLERLGILEIERGDGMSRKGFKEWREHLLAEKRNRTKTG